MEITGFVHLFALCGVVILFACFDDEMLPFSMHSSCFGGVRKECGVVSSDLQPNPGCEIPSTRLAGLCNRLTAAREQLEFRRRTLGRKRIASS